MKKYSLNPLTGKKIKIPSALDDRSNIDVFLEKNSEKKIIVVQGLGFVGAVMSIVCANSNNNNYAVIGIDLPNSNNYWKIDSINSGIFPVISSDKKIEKFFNKSKKQKNFYATYDSYAYSKADYIIVDINLDVEKKSDFIGNVLDFDVDISPFEMAIKSIGHKCKENVTILIETTIPPGTCEKVVKPTLDSCLSKRGLSNKKYFLGHSYERVMPGPDYVDSIKNFYRVFSGIDKKSEVKIEKFLKTIISTKKYPLTKLKNTNSTEIAKVLENSYRAMNIAFAVEWSRFAEEAGCNLYEIVDAIRMRPTHSNLMYPGIGVGGYCLTKDPLLASWSRKFFFKSKSLYQSENGVRINDLMPNYAYNFLVNSFYPNNIKNKNIIFFGVSYRSDISDTRYTPVERFYKFCKKAGSNIFLHDPYTKYWEELSVNVHSEDYSVFLKNDIDIVIITTSHSQYNQNEFTSLLLKKRKLFILDTVGVLNEEQIKKLSKPHKLKVLGRGDL